MLYKLILASVLMALAVWIGMPSGDRIKTKKLRQDVQIFRVDKHIRIKGHNQQDIFYTLGYVAARQRLWTLHTVKQRAADQQYLKFAHNLMSSCQWDNTTEKLLTLYASGINQYVKSTYFLPLQFYIKGKRWTEWTVNDTKFLFLNLMINPEQSWRRENIHKDLENRQQLKLLLNFINKNGIPKRQMTIARTNGNTFQAISALYHMPPSLFIPIQVSIGNLTIFGGVPAGVPIFLIAANNTHNWAISSCKTWDGLSISKLMDSLMYLPYRQTALQSLKAFDIVAKQTTSSIRSTYDQQACQFLPWLIQFLEENKNKVRHQTFFESVVGLWKGWDCHFNADSAAAALFSYLIKIILNEILIDIPHRQLILEDLVDSGQLYTFLKMDQGCKSNLICVDSCHPIILDGFNRMQFDLIRQTLTVKPQQIYWGRLHHEYTTWLWVWRGGNRKSNEPGLHKVNDLSKVESAQFYLKRQGKTEWSMSRPADISDYNFWSYHGLKDHATFTHQRYEEKSLGNLELSYSPTKSWIVKEQEEQL